MQLVGEVPGGKLWFEPIEVLAPKSAPTEKQTELPDPGEGWRWLSYGEVIEEDDEALIDAATEDWRKTIWAGKTFCSTFRPIRRRVKVPDPGPGHRLLKVGEVIRKGDEICNHEGQWLPCSIILGQQIKAYQVQVDWNKIESRFVRRKLPAASVTPGPLKYADRVEILDGTWKGCTGKVIGTALVNGAWSIENICTELENVTAGGHPLRVTVGRDSVRKVVADGSKAHCGVDPANGPSVTYAVFAVVLP